MRASNVLQIYTRSDLVTIAKMTQSINYRLNDCIRKIAAIRHPWFLFGVRIVPSLICHDMFCVLLFSFFCHGSQFVFDFEYPFGIWRLLLLRLRKHIASTLRYRIIVSVNLIVIVIVIVKLMPCRFQSYFLVISVRAVFLS